MSPCTWRSLNQKFLPMASSISIRLFQAQQLDLSLQRPVVVHGYESAKKKLRTSLPLLCKRGWTTLASAMGGRELSTRSKWRNHFQSGTHSACGSYATGPSFRGTWVTECQVSHSVEGLHINWHWESRGMGPKYAVFDIQITLCVRAFKMWPVADG